MINAHDNNAYDLQDVYVTDGGVTYGVKSVNEMYVEQDNGRIVDVGTTTFFTGRLWTVHPTDESNTIYPVGVQITIEIPYIPVIHRGYIRIVFPNYDGLFCYFPREEDIIVYFPNFQVYI